MKHMKMIVAVLALIAAMAAGYCLYQKQQDSQIKDNVEIQRKGSGAAGPLHPAYHV